MENNKHISYEELTAFRDNRMSASEKELFLGHICSCDYCSGLLAESMAKNTVNAPPDMKANILKAVKSPEVRIAAKATETSKRMQLFIYSLKVGTATIAALALLLLSINLNGDAAAPPKEAQSERTENSFSLSAAIRDNMDSLSGRLSDFSNKIMNTEVNDDERKEK